MKGNDLDNSIVPRDVIVYEGLLGLVSSQRSLDKWQKRKKWEKVLACYETNQMLARKIQDIAYRLSAEIDVVTFIGEEFAQLLDFRLHDEEELFVHNVYFSDPYVLARNLIYTPNVRAVYDSDMIRSLAYGAKGRHLLPDQFNMLGA